MSERKLEECTDTLRYNDAHSLEERAKRLQELGTTETSFSIQREWEYSIEAGDCYINHNYRSAIFCCACAVEQIFMYEYLKENTDDINNFDLPMFGKLIDRCENIASSTPYLKSAGLLNKIRNKVAAHPLLK
jgi:hypothetical protein